MVAQLNGRNVLACVTPARTNASHTAVMNVYPLPHQVTPHHSIHTQTHKQQTTTATDCAGSGDRGADQQRILCSVRPGVCCLLQAVIRDLVTDLELFFQHLRWPACHTITASCLRTHHCSL